MDEVRSAKLHEEGGQYICYQDDALWYVGADEVKSRGKNDHVEDVVDEP